MTNQARPRILMLTMHDNTDPRGGGPLRSAAVAGELRSAVGDVDVVWRWPVAGSAVTGGAAPGRPGVFRVLRSYLSVLVTACMTGSISIMRTVSWSMVRTVVALREGQDYQLGVVEYSTMAAYRRIMPSPTVIDLHNVESALARNYLRSVAGKAGPLEWWRRLRAWTDVVGLRRIESRLGDHFAGGAVVSEHDGRLLGSLATGARVLPVVNAPNGVSRRGFEGRWDRQETVVFVALLSWRPNIDAAAWLAREVWPLVRAGRPSARLQLVGAAPDRDVIALGSLPGVSVHGDVDDPLAFVGPAAVATAPLLAAGGTRLKILEALAAGTPVVATTMGALGLERLEGPHLSIVDSPAGFAEGIVKALDHRDEVARDDVRATVTGFVWEVALRDLIAMCSELVAGRGEASIENA